MLLIYEGILTVTLVGEGFERKPQLSGHVTKCQRV
jgi:phosphotransferase system IIA component